MLFKNNSSFSPLPFYVNRFASHEASSKPKEYRCTVELMAYVLFRMLLVSCMVVLTLMTFQGYVEAAISHYDHVGFVTSSFWFIPGATS